MANREQRSNKEKKKPKQDKDKPKGPQPSPFADVKAGKPAPAGKK